MYLLVERIDHIWAEASNLRPKSGQIVNSPKKYMFDYSQTFHNPLKDGIRPYEICTLVGLTVDLSLLGHVLEPSYDICRSMECVAQNRD